MLLSRVRNGDPHALPYVWPGLRPLCGGNMCAMWWQHPLATQMLRQHSCWAMAVLTAVHNYIRRKKVIYGLRYAFLYKLLSNPFTLICFSGSRNYDKRCTKTDCLYTVLLQQFEKNSLNEYLLYGLTVELTLCCMSYVFRRFLRYIYIYISEDRFL